MEGSHPALPGFERDEGLRDIYVVGTTNEDWRRFLRFARDSYPTEFLVELESREMPDDPVVIFELGKHNPVLMRMFLGAVQLNSYFFTTEEIDIDLDPTEVKTREDATRVLRFLKELGDALTAPC
jgi:hypothetical protein